MAQDLARSAMDMNSKFSSTANDAEARLRAKTYGLVTLEQMKAAQEAVETVLLCVSSCNNVATFTDMQTHVTYGLQPCL